MKNFLLFLILALPMSLLASQGRDSYDKMINKMAEEISDDLISMGFSKIAVTSIYDQEGQTNQLCNSLEEDLIVALLNLRKGLEIMDRNHLSEVLKEHQLAMNGLLNDKTLIEFGKLESVEAVITGTISSIENNFKVNMKAMSTISGMIISARAYSLSGNSKLRKLYGVKLKIRNSLDNSLEAKGNLLIKNNGKKREVIIFDQKDFRKSVIMHRGEEIKINDIPVGSFQINSFKFRKKKSILRTMLKPDNPIDMSVINIEAGIENMVIIK